MIGKRKTCHCSIENFSHPRNMVWLWTAASGSGQQPLFYFRPTYSPPCPTEADGHPPFEFGSAESLLLFKQGSSSPLFLSPCTCSGRETESN